MKALSEMTYDEILTKIKAIKQHPDYLPGDARPGSLWNRARDLRRALKEVETLEQRASRVLHEEAYMKRLLP